MLKGPLPRAEPRDRFAAAAVDFLPPFILLVATYVAGAPNLGLLVLLVSCFWYVTRDWLMGGRSLGKRWFGLQVIDDQTHTTPEPAQLILRNAVFGVPIVNAIAAVVELVALTLRPDKSRISDDYAGTSVCYLTAELEAHMARTQVRSSVPPSLRLFLQRQAAKRKTTVQAEEEGPPISDPSPSDPSESEPSPPPENSDHSASSDSLGETP